MSVTALSDRQADKPNPEALLNNAGKCYTVFNE